MVSKRLIGVFLLAFIGAGVLTFISWKVYLKMSAPSDQQADRSSCAYEEIDLVLPVKAFLKRCANSANLSYVRKLLVNQWISSNQDDLVALIVYGQGASEYHVLKKSLSAGMDREKHAKGAASFIENAIKIIDEDTTLIEHVNKSLKEGYDRAILVLRGELMNLDPQSKEYKKLRNEYRKQLDAWIDKKHGDLLDEIIAKI